MVLVALTGGNEQGPQAPRPSLTPPAPVRRGKEHEYVQPANFA